MRYEKSLKYKLNIKQKDIKIVIEEKKKIFDKIKNEEDDLNNAVWNLNEENEYLKVNFFLIFQEIINEKKMEKIEYETVLKNKQNNKGNNDSENDESESLKKHEFLEAERSDENQLLVYEQLQNIIQEKIIFIK